MPTPTLGEAAIRHFSKFGVSSCFLMEIDKAWELAVKTDVSQNRCPMFGKSPWWELSCDDDVWLHEQATMNRAQNSFVDEQSAQIPVSTRRTSLLFRRSQDDADTTSVDIRLDCEKQNLPLGPPRRAKPRARSNLPTHKKHATIHVDSTIQR